MTGNCIYFAFGMPPVTGGDYVALEHIAGLNRMGFNVKALYCGADDGIEKFPVAAVRLGTALDPRDIVVLSEVQHDVSDQLLNVPCIKVLHNQNPYYTFFGFASIAKLNAYPFTHVIVPSDFCAAKLRELGVIHPISRVRPCLPPYFKPGPKRLQIAFSPRKRWTEAHYLWGCFQSKVPEYARVPWVALDRMGRDECARIMAESAVYAAFPQLESLGLMCLEAMASDCHVVGYTGHGGVEYATAANGDWIAEGDHDAFVARLHQACRLFETRQATTKIQAGRATAAQFSRDTFFAELRDAWRVVMSEGAARYRK